MSSLFRLIGMVLILLISSMLILGVAGVLSSSEFWKNLTKILELAAIVTASSVIILLLGKKS